MIFVLLFVVLAYLSHHWKFRRLYISFQFKYTKYMEFTSAGLPLLSCHFVEKKSRINYHIWTFPRETALFFLMALLQHSKKRLLTLKRFPSLLKDFLFKIGMGGNPLTVEGFPLFCKWNPRAYKGNIILRIKENKLYDIIYKKCTQAQLWQMTILNWLLSIL